MTTEAELIVDRFIASCTDYFSIGESAITLPICGVFEIESGRIAAWREYFDMATGTPA